MKKIILTLICLVSLTAAAQADIITINDSVTYWPGYASNYTGKHNGLTQNQSEYWGEPNIISADVTFTGHQLTSISMSADFGSNSYKILPGDLFLDLNSDKTWDLVIDSYYLNNISLTTFLKTHMTAYTASIPLDAKAMYEYSDIYGTNPNHYKELYNAGGTPRYDHPISADFSKVAEAQFGATNAVLFDGNAGASGLQGWSYTGSTTFAWDLSALALDFDQYASWGMGINSRPLSMSFGFAVSCANDVVYGTVNVPTPEPGTLILAGLGLAGLGLMARRRVR